MQPHLTVLDETPTRVKLSLAGSLDMEGVVLLEADFQAQAGKNKSLLVEMSQVPFLSSMGIRMLVSANKSLRTQGHKVVLLRLQPLVDRTLRVMRLHEIMPIVDSDDAAQKALG